jgi:hypothetical protein
LLTEGYAKKPDQVTTTAADRTAIAAAATLLPLLLLSLLPQPH